MQWGLFPSYLSARVYVRAIVYCGAHHGVCGASHEPENVHPIVYCGAHHDVCAGPHKSLNTFIPSDTSVGAVIFYNSGGQEYGVSTGRGTVGNTAQGCEEWINCSASRFFWAWVVRSGVVRKHFLWAYNRVCRIFFKRLVRSPDALTEHDIHSSRPSFDFARRCLARRCRACGHFVCRLK